MHRRYSIGLELIDQNRIGRWCLSNGPVRDKLICNISVPSSPLGYAIQDMDGDEQALMNGHIRLKPVKDNRAPCQIAQAA
ncbi:hypothetical protein AC251_21035 (plasmid) [Ralstonia pseudosolanacearum]|nr:hypothetical protein BCR16_19505 [Ralstonia solanacearum FJAT-1458]API77081.1 hypothetical protein AC251_21035 [Ralstonia pseudosolanacearum]ASL75558.1 hypothetical protein BC350_17830 [Ralstonia pseudosolanacearum]